MESWEPFLGLPATLVCGRLFSRAADIRRTFSLATLMFIGAIVRWTPMMGARIVIDYRVARTFGVRPPRRVEAGRTCIRRYR